MRLRLAPRLTLVFMSMAALVLFALGVPVYYYGRSALLEPTISNLHSAAIEKEAALTAWVENSRHLLVTIAGLSHVRTHLLELFTEPQESAVGHSAKEGLDEHLRPWIGDEETFESFMIMEPANGEVTYSTDPDELHTFKENRPYFVAGRDGPFISQPYYSITRQEPMIVISTPVMAEDGTLMAVLAGRVQLDRMGAIIGLRSGLNQTDDAFLVSRSHLLVTQPRLIDDSSVLQRGVYTPAVESCLAGTDTAGPGSNNQGAGVIAVHHWLPRQELCLVVQIGRAEALAPVYTLGAAIAGSGLVILLLAAVAATALARMISRPILALRSGAAAIGHGDLDIRLPENQSDEIGELASEFNAMAGALKEKDDHIQRYAEELEDRVEARTAELRTAQEELVRTERLAALGQLTGTVSHELRNPLGAMRASIAAIKRLAPGEQPLLKAAVDITDRSITRCDNIIGDLLDYSRIRVLEKETITIDDWLDELLEEHPLADEIALHRDLKSGVRVAIDRHRFRRAVVNLLQNSCQAMQGDQDVPVERELSIATRQADGRLEVSISDTGPGISAEDRDKVFEPLYSTRSFGVGLGLAIVRQIMEQHGGGVAVASHSGHGNRMVLWLPLPDQKSQSESQIERRTAL